MLRFFLGSHTRRCPTKWHCSWPTPLPRPSSVCLLAWCGFSAPLSTSTAKRTDFQGFGTTSTRWAGPPTAPACRARWLAVEHTNKNNTSSRARDDDAIATRLEADLLPRSELCSPSPMTQAEPPMACNASVVPRSLDYLPAELPRETGQGALVALSPSLPLE